MDALSSYQLHIVICPWLAMGHLLPCLDLADRLASRGHRVSFVSTVRNISRLPPLRPVVVPLIDLVALPLPRVEGLPEGAESTNDISRDMLELHWMASDGLASPFSEFLDTACASTKKPDWVIVDTFPYWAVTATAKHKIPCAGLLLCSAGMAAPGPGVHRNGGSSENMTMSTRGVSGLSLAERVSMTLQGCQLVALRSCVELEPESVTTSLINGVGGKPFVTLGLLPPSRRSEEEDDGGGIVRRWLDAQPPKSVVYVALGSEVQLRAEQVHEMALGLELAGRRFLWALRKPVDQGDAADILPPGFEERTRGRGLVAMGWVSQLNVLAHHAVAAFLTHCGWGSTIEGLLYGHPLIMLPFIADQWPNAALMEGKQVGVQVARCGNDGSFDREAVVTAVRAVAADQDGIFTANAKKLQRIVADREYHERCIDGFIQHLRSHME